eukprot:SAG11_NODE_28758_length_318_cov_0.721461_1_plen_88_part_01
MTVSVETAKTSTDQVLGTHRECPVLHVPTAYCVLGWDTGSSLYHADVKFQLTSASTGVRDNFIPVGITLSRLDLEYPVHTGTPDPGFT